MRYRLVKRQSNAMAKDGKKKWYASPCGMRALDVRTMSRYATSNTTIAGAEMEAAFSIFQRYAIRELRAGRAVRLGDMGTLRLSFHSEGVDNINDFNPSAMISDVRVLFTPSKEFRDDITLGLHYENAGVRDEEGHVFSNLASYRRAKGLPSPRRGRRGTRQE